jgi:hypothetical protein
MVFCGGAVGLFLLDLNFWVCILLNIKQIKNMNNDNEILMDSCIPSPTDDRDLMFEGIAPSGIRYPKAMPAPFDLDWRLQGTNPYCVGMAGASANQQAKLRQKVNCIFDGQWGYLQCKKIDGAPTLQGTYLRAIMKVMKNTGFKSLTGGDPANYKIEEYASVAIDEKEIKIALFLYGAVIAAFRCSADGWKGDGQEVLPPANGAQLFGHAVLLTHYDENYIYGIDSLQNYHGGQIFKFKFANYKPVECWAITCDNKAIEGGLITGYVAKDYVVNGKTTARVNLRETPNGKVMRILPAGQAVKEFSGEIEYVGGIGWVYISVI